MKSMKPGTFDVPRDVEALITKFGGRDTHGALKQAGEAAGVSSWTMSKVGNGSVKASDAVLAKFKAALAKANGKPASSANGSASDMPEPITRLLDKFGGLKQRGSIMAARAALGVGETTFRRLMKSEMEITPELEAKIGRALGTYEPMKETPTLIIGTGKKKPPPKKSKFDKTDPPLIKELVAKFGGSRDAAGRAIGFSGAQLINDVSRGKRPMDTAIENRITAVLANQPLPKEGGDLDRFTMSIAIVVCNNEPSFERVYDAAEAFDCEWLFKINKAAMWIGFMRYPSVDKVRTFKKLCARDALAIVCP